MRLIFISIVIGVLVLSGCNAWNAPQHPTWTQATAPEHFERLMWKAIHDKDWREVDRHLAPVFVGSGPRGETLDHSSWIDYWKKAEIKDFSMGEFITQPDGTDMVATYVLHLSGAETNQGISAKGLRIVSVWQELKAGWVLTSQSATPIL